MIVTTFRRSLLRSATVRSPLTRQRPCFSCAKRKFSFSSSSPPPHPATSPTASMLGTLTGELDKLAPRFEVNAHSIKVLRAPEEFYETLKDRILSAKRRIFLSTLYIGKTEHDLISTLRTALLNTPTLHVSILTDALRGTRESPHATTASLLAPLLSEFPTRITLHMYHTPNLTGLRKRLVPRRLNEGWGLQHMKLYGIDDTIILSGANLSSDYFTNRQDRYHVFDDAPLTEYYAGVHEAVCGFSYRTLPGTGEEGGCGYELVWPADRAVPEPIADPAAFKKAAQKVLGPVMRPVGVQEAVQRGRTVVYPVAQFTPVLETDTSTEHPSVCAVLRLLGLPGWEESRWVFTAGYFNVQDTLKGLLLASQGRGTVVTAAPEANGFYGSKGVSGMLPDAYTLLARRFLADVVAAGKGSSVELREWRKGTHGVDPDAWTYHAKGVWVTLSGDKYPSITMVGSSNYTKRSYSLDLEVNALVVTEDEALKQQLGDEVEWLQENSKEVTMKDFERTERRVSLKVRLALWIVGVLGGQL